VKSIPAGLLANAQAEVATLALCWRITRQDAVLILGTESDEDVVVPSGALAGTYLAKAGITGSSVRSTSDLAVDNLEVQGSVLDDITVVDLNAADIEAGLFDLAEVILFAVNWAAPSEQVILRKGNIGAVERTAEGQYRTELRGLFQLYQQQILRTYGVMCDAELGDARCGVGLTGYTITGTVTAVTSRRRFDSLFAASPMPAAGEYTGGLLTFTTGPNAGYSREVKEDAVGSTVGDLEISEMFPVLPEIGDEFTLSAGCDKAYATCKDRFNNLLNFRGHGHFVPGQNELIKVGRS
jgi:uncharacterized phage protein (TIGR02218 family)